MIEHHDLSTPVYHEIKRMIIKGQLKPGEKLKQENLANRLRVSRTPLMKALQMLEHELLVESKPRRGMYVREITWQDMVDVYDCREALEAMAVQLVVERASQQEVSQIAAVFQPFTKGQINRTAYEKADEKFHDLIIEYSKNPVLKRMSAVGNVHQRVYQFGLLRPPEVTLEEHLSISEAIEARDAKTAVVEIKNHIDQSRQVLLHRINEEV